MPPDFKSAAFKEGEKKQREIHDKYQAQMEERWRGHRPRRRGPPGRPQRPDGRDRPAVARKLVHPADGRTRSDRLARIRELPRQVGRFEEVLNRDIFNKQRMTRTPRGIAIMNEAEMDAQAPVFTYAPMPLEDVVRNVLPDLVILLAVNLVLFAGAFVAFLRVRRQVRESTMFGILYLKELRENVQNYRFLLALVLCTVVIPLGFYVSQNDYAQRRQAYDQTVRGLDQSHTLMADLIRNGGAAFRPPSPLGLLSDGIETILPSSVETQGYVSDQGAQVRFNNTRRLENPFTALFGRLDLAFMVSTVLAVLVMIFTFNAVAGEKERRTLAQVMANPVPRATVITAKMAAASSLLAAAFLAGTAAGVLLTTALGLGPFGEAGTWGPFLIGIGVALVFLIVFVNLGLLVSAVTLSPVSAMVTLLAVWVGLAMVLPEGERGGVPAAPAGRVAAGCRPAEEPGPVPERPRPGHGLGSAAEIDTGYQRHVHGRVLQAEESEQPNHRRLRGGPGEAESRVRRQAQCQS